MSLFNRGKRYATGIEIGTSKICVVIAEVSKGHPFKILGIGQSPSRGVRKGVICKPEYTNLEIRDAVAEAERSADAPIGDVCVGITGSHIRNVNSQGEHLVESEDGVVSQEDKLDVLKNAEECRPREVDTGYLLHRIRQPYFLDGVPVDDPVGKTGEMLTLPMHWVYGMGSMVRTPVAILRDLCLEPKYPIFSGFAATLALMDAEQRQHGGLVIDLGAGTTEYVFVQRGHIRHAGVLPIGGDHVSNDLALGLKLEIGVAENLKISRGRAISDPQAKDAMLPFECPNGERKSIRFDHFQLIMELRLKEIFQIILTLLTEAQLHLTQDQGVMICGGGACIQMIEKLAASVFQVKTLPYKLSPFEGMCDAIKKPQFATPIGLARYCAAKMAREKGGPLAKIFNPKGF